MRIPLLTAAFGIMPVVSALVNHRTLTSNYHRFSPRSLNITWEPCDEGSDRVCGSFDVPLDYQDESAGKATLTVARYPAMNEPKLGTLFLNPGGPAESGVEFILGALADRIMSTSGGKYDLVGWDPRGVGLSQPQLSCFENATEEVAFWEGTSLAVGLEARGNFTDQANLDAFYAEVPQVDKLLIELGQRCVERNGDALKYVGTTATVRDMVALHDYLEGPDKPIDYWGFSYGTAIGIYFVNMFPSRVGRVVLDGVVDPVYWANRPPHEEWAINVESTDEAFTGFVSACAAAGPQACAIASQGSTPDSLREEVQQLLDLAYDYRKAKGAGAEISSAVIRFQIFNALYQPVLWVQLAEQLKGYQDQLANLTSSGLKRSFIHRQTTEVEPPVSDIGTGRRAITCADAVDAGGVTTQMVFDEIVKVSREVSPMCRIFLSSMAGQGAERYTGPWNNKLSNPILVIGNEADPITPYRSAKSVADALGDSAILIEQDDYGHASLAMRSNCTMAALNNYFLHNQLPSADKFCGTNQVLFPGPGVTKNTLAALNTNLATSDSSNLETELQEARSRSNRLFIGVIALSAAVGLLLISLVIYFIVGRRKRAEVPKWRVDLAHDEHEDQGHVYKTPYDPASGSSGYAAVKT